MNILLVIFSLSFVGGAERVLTEMANYWAEKDWKVTIATFDHGENQPFYDLSPRVKHEPLCLASVSSNFFWSILNNYQRMKSLKKYFLRKDPDIIISFVAKRNILTLLSTLNTGIPVIVSERKNPALSSNSLIDRYLRKWLYPKASGVVCQTKAMMEYYMPDLKHNAVVIPNPVLKGNTDGLSPEIFLPEGKLLLAVGSMTSREKVNQKGFDMLIPVFSDLAPGHKDWKLVILGDGPERDHLKQIVKNHNLEDRVFLPGIVKNIHSVFKQGDLFVLSSRYEGFPNALVEAMSCGLPAVSFDCPTGPGEIIRNGVDGYLVKTEDLDTMQIMLGKLMEDQVLRKFMSEKAREVLDRFNIDSVMEEWEKIINRSVTG